MRILIVHEYYYPHIGGVEHVFTRLAEGLVARGHQVRVITTRIPGTSRRECIKGVDVERIGVGPFRSRYFFSILALGPALREARRHQVVHTSAYNGAFPAFLGARLAHKPIVFTAPEVLGARWLRVESNLLKALGFRIYEHLVMRLPYDHVAAISQATLTDLLSIGVPEERASCLYLGIDNEVDSRSFRAGALRSRINSTADEFVYVYFGRPGITKGVDFLLDAAPLVQRRAPHSHLVLILATQPKANYERAIGKLRKLGALARITLLPPYASRQELYEAVSDADCVVVPSLTEGFGLAVAEACARNIPVVATRAGSIPEVIAGRHVLVEPASAESLADGIIRATRNDYDSAPPKVFSWTSMIDGYERIYGQLLGEK